MNKDTMMKLKYLMLDTEQTQWWINHLFNKAKEEYFNKGLYDDVTEINSAQDKALMCLEIYKKIEDVLEQQVEEKYKKF